MIKTIIVDDETKSRLTLENLLTKNCHEVEVVQLCSSAAKALQAIEKHKPLLVFLDIEMPVENGFAVLEKFKNPNFHVVFTSAHSQYGIRAIKFSALDYLLKPIDVEELKMAVNKVREKNDNEKKSPPDFELLLLNLKGKSVKIGVPTFDGIQMLKTADIIKCMAHESYTEIYMMDGSKILVSRLLKEYEELLGDLNFLRIHHSCLVNLAHVKKYIKGEGGYVEMIDGKTCEVSRRKKAELLNRLALLEI